MPAMLRQPISEQLTFVEEDNDDGNDLHVQPTTCGKSIPVYKETVY